MRVAQRHCLLLRVVRLGCALFVTDVATSMAVRSRSVVDSIPRLSTAIHNEPRWTHSPTLIVTHLNGYGSALHRVQLRSTVCYSLQRSVNSTNNNSSSIVLSTSTKATRILTRVVATAAAATTAAAAAAAATIKRPKFAGSDIDAFDADSFEPFNESYEYFFKKSDFKLSVKQLSIASQRARLSSRGWLQLSSLAKRCC